METVDWVVLRGFELFADYNECIRIHLPDRVTSVGQAGTLSAIGLDIEPGSVDEPPTTMAEPVDDGFKYILVS